MTDRRTVRKTVGQIERRTNGQTDRQTDRLTVGPEGVAVGGVGVIVVFGRHDDIVRRTTG